MQSAVPSPELNGPEGVLVGVAGGLILLLALTDLFVTVFNYYGFTFLSGRLHSSSWSELRTFSRVLPERARHGFLSVGSAAMLPATLLRWLALEMTGFALMYFAGLSAGDFTAQRHGLLGAQGAFYLSGGRPDQPHLRRSRPTGRPTTPSDASRWSSTSTLGETSGRSPGSIRPLASSSSC